MWLSLSFIDHMPFAYDAGLSRVPPIRNRNYHFEKWSSIITVSYIVLDYVSTTEHAV